SAAAAEQEQAWVRVRPLVAAPGRSSAVTISRHRHLTAVVRRRRERRSLLGETTASGPRTLASGRSEGQNSLSSSENSRAKQGSGFTEGNRLERTLCSPRQVLEPKASRSFSHQQRVSFRSSARPG